MKFNDIAAAAGLSLVLASGAALAQGAMVEVSDRTMVAPFGMDADRLEDIDVYSQDGNEIGDVEEIVGPNADTATHIVVDFDDDSGFSDRDDVVVPIEAFMLDADRQVISLSAPDVSTLPTWDD